MDKPQREPLVEVRNLKTQFFLDEGTVHAVDGADFTLYRGETLGVVGESGCGKSVTARSILRIVPRPGRITQGEILYHRRSRRNGGDVTEVIDLTTLDERGPEIRSIRGAEISMVFQEPMTSLSPVHTLGSQIMEAILLHQEVSNEEAKELSVEMLQRVGMPQPRRTVDRYPHELSGGMRQRGMIAMALSCQPSLLIADEPTTALDVTTEAQILQLMRGLQSDLGMAIMFITHNLGVIAQMTEHVIVMYLGKVVEEASVDNIFYNPKHPYTEALLRSIPRVGRKSRERLESIKGTVPDPYNIPPGCPYHPRCNYFMPGRCDVIEPPLFDVGTEHRTRCLLYGDPESLKTTE
ncbi:MAG: ABC transporter ATP-binding protein [Chloroflexi bacterium]|nr:ABC transporter ATP-binding protein [Chloroflexota bacterium]